MYNRGTKAEFDAWHAAAMAAEGITPQGKVGFVDGRPAPENQRTTAYSSALKNPNGSDDYIWPYGAHKMAGKTKYYEIPAEFLEGYVAPMQSVIMKANI